MFFNDQRYCTCSSERQFLNKVVCFSCVSAVQLRAAVTVRLHGEQVGLAEGALGADVHVDGGEAEVVPRVVWLRFSHIQVPRHL